jgi:hypothetical protein
MQSVFQSPPWILHIRVTLSISFNKRANRSSRFLLLTESNRKGCWLFCDVYSTLQNQVIRTTSLSQQKHLKTNLELGRLSGKRFGRRVNCEFQTKFCSIPAKTLEIIWAPTPNDQSE